MLRLVIGLGVGIATLILTFSADAQWQGLCAGTWVPSGYGMRCVCPDGSDGYYSGGRHTCGGGSGSIAPILPPAPRPGCAAGYYRQDRFCVPIGTKLCPGTNGKISCPSDMECSGNSCIPFGSVDCQDGTVCKIGTVCWTNPQGIPDLEPGKKSCPSEEEHAKLLEKVENHRNQQRAEQERRQALQRAAKRRKEHEAAERDYRTKLNTAKADQARYTKQVNQRFEATEKRTYTEMIAARKAEKAGQETAQPGQT